MTTPFLIADLKGDEGCRLKAYPDPLTRRDPFTVGYGHTGPDVLPSTRWTQEEADTTLAHDVANVCDELDERLAWWRKLCDARQDVLANMAFNMGVAGLLKFKRTLALIEAGDYANAALAILDSLWADQVGHRANRLAQQMKTGVRAA